MKKVIPGKIKTQLRLDGYYNVLNKYGTQHDSTEYYQWASGSAVSDTELADLYAGNGLFSTIIDAPADDATKNGIDLGIKDKDLQKQIDNHLQTIRYQSKFAKALRWARLFGGAAVVMLVDDGRLLQDPLNWRDVHGVEELLVYGRNEMYPLWVSGYENNPDDEDYRRGGTGIPEYYQVNSVYGNYVVHSSRCLVFHNSDIPESSTMANLYRTWGIPEYLRIREELRNASIGPGYSIRLLERLSMVTYKMKNLAGVLSTADGEDTVLQRMDMATAGDLGLDLTPDGIATMNRLNELEDVTIEVGYQADQKAADGETSLAEIVYWNHYGTVHKDGSVMIPARPFMDTIKKHSEELSEFSQQALSSLDTADAVANAIGSQAKSMIQEAIKGEEWTPNAPITVEGGWMINEYGKKGPVPVYVEGKGSTKPLIDTGFMRQNCQYVIVKGKK